MAINDEHAIQLPAIRGIQANREYYVVMCPLRIVASLFHSDADDIPPELRAQRALNRGRIPQLARYVIENPDTYVFSSLAASVDAEMNFVPSTKDGVGRNAGLLGIPTGSRVLINDGQHRLAGIREAIKRNVKIGDESISIVVYADAGLTKSQQMFADLNRYAVRPTRSLNILYDRRDPLAILACDLADSVPVFHGMTRLDKNTISNRERKLFTLNSIYHATERLLMKPGRESISEAERQVSRDFWSEVGKQMPDWLAAAEGKANPYELRKTRVHAHGIALLAIGTAGHTLLSQYPKRWKQHLAKLAGLDWSKSNPMWEGRALSRSQQTSSEKRSDCRSTQRIE
jgi:DNA sulfur modification protein DndB